jgi:hypothetical protein
MQAATWTEAGRQGVPAHALSPAEPAPPAGGAAVSWVAGLVEDVTAHGPAAAGRLSTRRGMLFTDIVESDDPRVAGINRPRLAIDVDPRDGSGSLSGDFELQLSAGGSWRGVLSGTIVGGLVRAEGLAVGTGPYAACAMRVDFQQVAAHAGQPPCAEPKAFFEMKGQLLSQD